MCHGKVAYISGSENFPWLIPDNAISFLPHDMVHGEDFGILDFDTLFAVEAIALSLPNCLVVQGGCTDRSLST